ncbi:Rieske (2Fe-2S) protein [Branchiibius sp. NY16-3462-2]|uniref:Rieske (2Fe-2S) protein n=1 Tax=Branchiibius sp. NY16-3462-2 TaxID=1807500 RepID=UPI0025BA8CDD|nr:Rieske (2Fe-2S) protein [Branchiibius sp. NY16-3462-2]
MSPDKNTQDTPQQKMQHLVADRRAVLRSAGLGGSAVAATVALAACGQSSDSGTGATTGTTPSTTSSAAGTSSAQSGGAAAKATVAASEVPVGGGVIVQEKYVVTQPTSGEYKAFTAICTHQGCPVTSVADGVIKCPCHGSEFSISDGSVKQPPATEPLASYTATLEGSEVRVS